MMIMAPLVDPATFVIIIAVLLLAEGIFLTFLFRRYYRKKLEQSQNNFAGYLKFLDEENQKLKEKLAKKKQ